KSRAESRKLVWIASIILISGLIPGLILGLILWPAGRAWAAAPSPPSSLLARGYTLLPSPQRVNLKQHDFRFGQDWGLRLGSGVPSDDIAVESLRDALRSR